MAGRAAAGRHAIIDIGSNSVRLVVYGAPARAPSVLLNEKVTPRLGRNVGETGLLSDKAMKTALAALGRYAVLLRLMGIDDVETVATAAVRDAANGGDFLDAVGELGLNPRLLSGEEEAITGAHGVMAAFPGAKGVVADLGGGSLELTELDGAHCRHGVSMPFGTLRLEALRAAGVRKFTARVHKALRAAEWSAGAGLPLYLVGGSWRALARYVMFRLGWPLDDPHGWELDTAAALKLLRGIGRGKLATDVPRLPAARLASLPDAAALLAVLAREIAPASLVFSSWGLREGLLFRRLSPAVRVQDPMLAGVAAFTATFDVTPSAAAMVADWTADACGARDGGTGDSAARERLRLAATMLALAAQRIEPNLRTEQAMDWALRKRWIGIGDRERAILAMAAMANSGRTRIPPEFLTLASGAELRDAVSWGLAIRLCRKFSGCVARSLSGSSLSRRAGRLVLTVQPALQPLHTEAVDRDLRLLAGWLAAEPAVEPGEVPAEAQSIGAAFAGGTSGLT
ncbi:MAG: exopolyphosphatase [Novosphingobium sp.]|jgi:exopolyphosphatase/guanosine-5'-triphosphate,3'-diphosphate pyrophosphatase|nr:exopolyphosphatase [Novosphingobium sp.]